MYSHLGVCTELLYLFGGWDGSADLSDLWQFSVGSSQWLCLSADTSQEVCQPLPPPPTWCSPSHLACPPTGWSKRQVLPQDVFRPRLPRPLPPGPLSQPCLPHTAAGQLRATPPSCALLNSEIESYHAAGRVSGLVHTSCGAGRLLPLQHPGPGLAAHLL